MRLSKEDIKTLVNGFFQSGIEKDKTLLENEDVNTLHPVELFLNDLIALNFSLKNESASTSITDEKNHCFSPYKTGLELTKNKHADHLSEYLHLCRSYKMHLHPVVAFYHFMQSNKAHHKAIILQHSNKSTIDKLVEKGLLNPLLFDSENNAELSNQELLLQMFLKFRNEEYRKGIYNKIEQLQDLNSKRAFLNNLTHRQKLILPPAQEESIQTASKKWNTQWLKLQLVIEDSPAARKAHEQISNWLKSPDSDKWTVWSKEGMKSCGIDYEEEWLFFLISNTRLPDAYKTIEEEGLKGIPEYLLPALLQNALFFKEIELFKMIAEKHSSEDLIALLEKIDEHVEKLGLDWEFIKKVISSLNFSSESEKWKTYAILLKHYKAFLPDSFTLELIPVIKDNESRIYMTEVGVKVMSFLTEKLSLQANPIHLPKLENHLQQLIYHPLEKQIEKMIGFWRFRLEMRKNFEREKKAKSINEKR